MWKHILRPAIIYFIIFNGWVVLLSVVLRNYANKYFYLRLGVLGTALVIISLTYSIRRHLISRWGPLKNWLRMHAFFGTAGGLLALLHADLKLNSLVASLAFMMMEVVILTGYFAYFAAADQPDFSVSATNWTPYWRAAHIYSSLILFLLTAFHIFAEFFYRGLYL